MKFAKVCLFIATTVTTKGRIYGVTASSSITNPPPPPPPPPSIQQQTQQKQQSPPPPPQSGVSQQRIPPPGPPKVVDAAGNRPHHQKQQQQQQQQVTPPPHPSIDRDGILQRPPLVPPPIQDQNDTHERKTHLHSDPQAANHTVGDSSISTSSIEAWTRQKERELTNGSTTPPPPSRPMLPPRHNRLRQEQEATSLVRQSQSQSQQPPPKRIVHESPHQGNRSSAPHHHHQEPEWIVKRQTGPEDPATRRSTAPPGQYPQQQRGPPRPQQQPPLYPRGRQPPPQHHQYQQHQQRGQYQHQQRQYQQQQQQQHPGQMPPPQHHALVPRQPQRPPPTRRGGTLGSSLFSKFANQLDSLADVDTMVSQKAQMLKKTVGERSGSLRQQVSGMGRKIVFDASGVTTGVRDGIKDVARGGINRIFGGAPTGSGETQDEWEVDRRNTATERRRKLILGSKEGDAAASNASGVDPFRAQLNSLLTDYPTEDTNILDAENDFGEGDEFGHDYDPQHDDSSTDDEIEMNQQQGARGVPENSPYGGGYTQDGSNSEHDERGHLQRTPQAHTVDTVDPATFFRDPRSTISSTKSDEHRGQHVTKRSPPSFDNDDDSSFSGKVGKAFQSFIPPIPSLKFSNKFRRSSAIYNSAWSDHEDEPSAPKSIKNTAPISKHRITNESGTSSVTESSVSVQSAITDLIENRKSTNILSSKEMRQCKGLGKGKAFFDTMVLVFASIFLNELIKPVVDMLVIQDWFIPQNLIEIKSLLQNTIMTVLPSIMKDSWAIYALSAALLSRFSQKLIFDPKEVSIANQATKRIQLNVPFSQLFLRLTSGNPIDQVLPRSLCASSTKEISAVIANSRLRSFIFMTIAVIVASTLSILQPVVWAIVSALHQLLSLETLWERPVPLKELGANARGVIQLLGTTLQELIGEEIEIFSKCPLAVVSPIVLSAVLISFIILPLFESNLKRKDPLRSQKYVHDRDVVDSATFANLGVSSASRIGLQMHNGSVERILHRFRSVSARKRSSVTIPSSSRQISLMKFVLYILSNLLCFIPLLVHFVISAGITSTPNVELNWNKIDWTTISCMALLMVQTKGIASEALKFSSAVFDDLPTIVSFKNALTSTFHEVHSGNTNPQADLRLTASASSSEGVVVSNLWAAHVSRRAWACRGANLFCKNGEVLLLLGDDSSGKTRLLTAIAELIAVPPKSARTTTLAKGQVSVGGVDVMKWDRAQLKRKVGIFLNDVRSFADFAQLSSGMTLGEILTPIQSNGKSTTHAVDFAVQLSGISSSLLPRLGESKLQTFVTANEDQISPSPLRPDLQLMSSSEWSKVILAKVLSQAIFTNDNPMASPDTVAKCLVGSVLFLDDVTAYMSEIEEARVIKSLRRSGAATIITSNRWAIGRFASRIAVIANGKICEIGTHSELIAKGANNSLYASRWDQMTAGT